MNANYIIADLQSILQLVTENQRPNLEQFQCQVEYIKAVLQAAQAEAEQWRLPCMKLWHPTPLAEQLLAQSGLEHRRREREEDSIASLRWFGEGSSNEDDIEWVACEKYAWV